MQAGGGGNNLPTSMEDFSLFVHNTNLVSGPVIESALFKEIKCDLGINDQRVRSGLRLICNS